ncbi:rhodanese-like domain-containing protein [Bacillus thermotolerans]|uniref:rhodanese-like domain-containing protein n=1 Tax=Bacillus thermotolerans TaxID=1221996 RepID=UPI00057D9332|nr:rhodanese-like domain-containing protein [Bacillus thermotolerans]KKB38065.1 Rhodanese-like domain protein [Bacillus thermotolerans]KKB41685.1 Rhodanese-like domain protein [Bacillus thermotolerans]
MEYINYILMAFLAFFIIQRVMPGKGIKQISTAELKSELKDSAKQFIDVRTPGEFRGNHIRGFKNIPLHQLSNKAQQLSKEKEVIVICQSGMRSQKASKILRKQGFTKVTNVKGGMSAWS